METTLADTVHRMYREIIVYGEALGDSTTGLWRPFTRLREYDANSTMLTEFELTGLCIGGLCQMEKAIDNGTYADAVASYKENVELVLQMKPAGVPPSVFHAYEAFERSEDDFTEGLQRVYREVVLPAELADIVHRMYREIIEYGGAFGDSITGLCQPFTRLREYDANSTMLTEFELTGLCIGGLCAIGFSIDNGTYAEAVAGYKENVDQVLQMKPAGVPPSVFHAYEALERSEGDFLKGLRRVYREVVLPAELAAAVSRMYWEIIEDGRASTGLWRPFSRLREYDANSTMLTEFELTGLCIGGLCRMEMAIDNGTYEDAVASYKKDVDQVLQMKPAGVPPSVFHAYEAFERSEDDFTEGLQRVYREVVLPAEIAYTVQEMYREIIEYGGAFGSPTEGLWRPFTRLREYDANSTMLTEFELTGLCIGGLCQMEMAIDNGTYADAVAGYKENVDLVLQMRPWGVPPSVFHAYEAFERSEDDFTEGLQRVYREVVLRAESADT